MAIKGVIFDMDGVVVDSEPIHVPAEKEVLRRNNIIVTDDWSIFRGTTWHDMFTDIVNRYDVKHTTAEKLVQELSDLYYERAETGLVLYEGFQELLSYLKTRYKIGLTTSSMGRSQNQVFRIFNLDDYFDAVTTSDEIPEGKGKPHPLPYQLTIEKLGLKPEECVVIEDAPNGITSAKAAGAKTIAVLHTVKDQRKFPHADYVCENHHEVKSLLERLFD